MQYIEEPFDPTLFGFERVSGKGGRGSALKDDDYLLFSQNRNKCRDEYAVLCLCKDTAAFVRELFGPTVRVDINSEGKILLSKGNDRRMSPGKAKDSHDCISLGSETVRLRRRIGLPGTRIRMKATTYAHGDAVLFTPDGEL